MIADDASSILPMTDADREILAENIRRAKKRWAQDAKDRAERQREWDERNILKPQDTEET